jgi:hypothetical protein
LRAIARIDLISLKAIASRNRDLIDLESLQVTRTEIEFILGRLPALLERGTNPDHVETAMRTLRAIGGLDDLG